MWRGAGWRGVRGRSRNCLNTFDEFWLKITESAPRSCRGELRAYVRSSYSVAFMMPIPWLDCLEWEAVADCLFIGFDHTALML